MEEQIKIVDAFADLMKIELEANSHKGDWTEWKDSFEMLEELSYHQEKLRNAIIRNDISLIKEHIADCMNFLMMIGNAHELFKKD